MTELKEDNFYKILVEDYGQSKRVQLRLFSLGYSWVNIGKRFLDEYHPYLYLTKNKHILAGKCGLAFKESNWEEITLEDLKNVNKEEENEI